MSRERGAALAAVLACVAAALWVYRGALGAYFSPDDFIMLEKARGLLPNPVSPWRLLSGPAYFGAAAPAFGVAPFGYHLVNWLLHGLNVALLFAFARSRGHGVPAAALAAGLFGTSRLYFSAVYPATGVGELLALGLVLGSLTLAAKARGWAGMAAPLALLAAALLCKENVLLLPLVLLLPAAAGPAVSGAPSPAFARLRVAALLAPGALIALYLGLTHVRTGSLAGSAYAMGFGGNLFHNLMTYCAWIVDLAGVAPDAAGRISFDAWRTGALVAILWAAVAALAWRRTTLPAAGGAWFLLALAPVLPLLHHSYLYYLYTPLAGAALAAAGVLEWVTAPRGAGAAAGAGAERAGGKGRRGGGREARGGAKGSNGEGAAPPSPARGAVPREAWVYAAVAAAVLAHAIVSDRLLARRAGARLQGIDLPADPYFRKSEMARRMAADVGRGLKGGHVKALFFVPRGSQKAFDTVTGQQVQAGAPGHRTYDLAQEAFDDGRALRMLYPSLDTVSFTHRWLPEHGDFDVFLYNGEGRVLIVGRGPEAHRAMVTGMLSRDNRAAALEHLETVVPLYPDDSWLRFRYALLLGLGGRPAEGEAQLRELLRRTPAGRDADQARALLERIRVQAR